MEDFRQLAIVSFLVLGLIVLTLSLLILFIAIKCAQVLRRVNKMIKILQIQNAFLAASSTDHGWLPASRPATGAG